MIMLPIQGDVPEYYVEKITRYDLNKAKNVKTRVKIKVWMVDSECKIKASNSYHFDDPFICEKDQNGRI